MKNQKISQFISCATMFAVMSAMTACGDNSSGGGNNGNNRTPQTADKLISNSYSGEPVETPEDIKDVRNISYSPADDVYYCYASVGDDYKEVIYSITSDFSSFNPINIEFDEKKESYIGSMNVLSDGGFALFISETSYGDLPLPDYEDKTIDWETFDWAPYEEAREQAYIYRIYDKDGKMLSSTKLNYEPADQYAYISGYYGFADGSSVIYTESEGIVKFDKDGKSSPVGKVDDLQWVDSISADADNNLILAGYGGEGGYIFVNFDIENKSTSEKYEYEGNLNSSQGVIRGVGDYSFFVMGDKSLDGYNKNTKKFEEIVNWNDSDIANVSGAVINKDMQITVTEYSDNRGSMSLSKLTKRDPSEFANQQIITIGMLYDNGMIGSEVADFNKSNKDYRIKMIDYSEYDNEENEYTGAIQQLSQDLISGKAPDIVMSGGNLNMQSLASKGVFADLYEFLDKDEEIKRESFVPNILNLSEYDGKLVSIATSFTLNTLSGKTKHVGEKQNWTVDEMIAAYEKRPEKMALSINDYKTQVFYNCFNTNLMSNIDYKNKTFTYDKAELVKLLEFVNQFEDEPNWEDENVQMENKNEWNDYQTAMIKDKYLLYNTSISDFRSYHELLAGTFANEPVTLVGYPSADGSGTRLSWAGSTFSIVSNSANKDACWKFIRQFLTEDYQSPSDDGNDYMWAFPVNQNAFDKLAENSKSPRFWIDPETGKKTEYDTTFWTGNKEVKIGDCTDEEIQQVKDLINSVKSATNYYDKGLYDICEEETGAFFKGDKSAEETADLMINRISIYIAEKG